MKFYGIVGFWQEDVETAPSVYQSVIVERNYVGDVITNRRNWQNFGDQNDSLVTKNQISILSDLFARQNWQSIKYVIWNGMKVKVTSVTIDYPRITLELGGVYNGENAPGIGPDTPEDPGI